MDVIVKNRGYIMNFSKISRIFLSLFFIIVFVSQAMEGMNPSHEDQLESREQMSTNSSNQNQNETMKQKVFKYFCRAYEDFCKEVFGDFNKTMTLLDATRRMSDSGMKDSFVALMKDAEKYSVVKKVFDIGVWTVPFYLYLMISIHIDIYNKLNINILNSPEILFANACNIGIPFFVSMLFVVLIVEGLKYYFQKQKNELISILTDPVYDEYGDICVFDENGTVVRSYDKYAAEKDLGTITIIVASIELGESLPRKIIGYVLSRAGSAVASTIGNAASSVVSSVKNQVCRPVNAVASTISNAASNVKNTVIDFYSLIGKASGIASVVCHRKQKPAAQKA